MSDAKKCDNCGTVDTSPWNWRRIVASKIGEGAPPVVGRSISDTIIGDYCSTDCIVERIEKDRRARAESDRRYELMNAIDTGAVVCTPVDAA